jgi:Putative Ig domain/Galactose oxidase, central domain/Kelch motif
VCIPSCTRFTLHSRQGNPFPTRFLVSLIALAFLCAAFTSGPASAQTAGQNVNMVSGTGWTNGDPFLERQNEPSLAVSTRNSSHLFGASNDYRSVDLPGLLGIDERGDAWLGIYKSFDGGRTWQSTLLPGFPLDGSPEGLASPIHGRQAAADPLVRAGSNGLFFLTGIAFDRGSNPLSKVFISRFIDLNNKENGDAANENGALTNLAPRDPVKYVDTRVIDSGSANRFLDKPWVAVDIPRSHATCTINANEDGTTVTQRIAAGAIYVTYTAFTTVGTVQNSQILFRRSMDCGVTWSKPIVLSQNDDPAYKPDAEGQGTVIAIDPSVPANQPAKIYVAWRVFAEPGDPDDANQIRIARSSDGGISFDEQEPAVTFPLSCNKTPTGVGCPFDQGETGTSFRSNGYPALTVDNVGRVYLAWSQRDTNGDGRITMTVMNRVEQCSSSRFKQIDPGAVYDDYGNAFTNLSDRGSQLMPTLNFNAGKLMLTYYDLRQDHTSGTLTPAAEPTCDPILTPLCPIGNPFTELRDIAGELLTNPMSVFTAYVDDSTLTVRRHTLDIVGSEGTPVINPWILDVPIFTHFRVSRYEYGIIPPGTDVQQAQFNAPNLPMFVQGTAPFMGDYIDVAGAPAMVPDNSRNGDGWKFNTSPATNPVFHAAWTDNRDVLPPPDGISWDKYTPPISASIGPTSKFDPTKTPPACVSGYSGMRNQNIYTSAISHGLILTSPQTAKPVLQSNGQPIPREFSLVMRNETNDSRTFQLTIPAQPASAQASFLQFSLQNTLTVNIPALSSASRPVFLTPSAGSTVFFPAFEVDAAETDGAKPPLTASILFNADPTNPALANPDNAAFGSGSISSQEFYNPAILNPAILNPAILNPAILNPAILNPGILNPAILNPAILNPAILNPNFVVALNPAILNPAILNPAILNNAVANPAILNPAILNTPVSDANYTITNEGNTSATYQLQLFQSGPLPASAVFQIILTKTYLTPGVSPTDGCTYGGQVNNEVVASIDNPVFVTDPSQLGNPAILNSAINNPTFSIAPGDTLQVTLRANLTIDQLANVVLHDLSPVVAAQAVNTVDVQQGITTPPITLLISTAALPSAVTGQPYSATLTALGGIPPVSADAWSLIGGSLPPGLNLSAAGIISGTPTVVGTFPFVVQVTDTGTPQHIASRQFSITVAPPVAITTPALPSAAPGAQYTQVVTATGGFPPYTWTSTGKLPPGLTLSSTTGVISGIPTTAGTYSFSVMVSDSLGVFATASYTIVISTTVTQPAQITFLVQPSNAVGSQAISPTVQVQVSDVTGAPLPNTTVTMSIANLACPSATLSGTLTGTTNANGIASFANLNVDHGQRNYTLAATVANSSGISNPFNVEGYCETGSMNTARHNHILLGLPNGKVLITGGAVNANSTGALASAELYDPVAHTFTNVGPMNVARLDHTVTLLPNGKVLVAGGFNDSGVVSSAELFDPATNAFTLLTARMTSLRAEHTATLLANGKVLIAGGNTNTNSVATAEIFDPTAGTFTVTSHTMTTARQIQHADLLPNGQVLISGGFDNNNNPLASAELYDPVADTFTATGSMATARGNHASALLYNGKVLVAGGLAPGDGAAVPTATAELYDPSTGLFTTTGSMSIPRAHYAPSILDDGTIFIQGGASLPAGTSADVYNPATGTFRTTANFTAAQAGMRDSILPDGTVLLASGVNGQTVAVPNSEVFYPLSAPAGITITTLALPNANQNQPYSQLFLEFGGAGNLTWTVASGALPTGLTLSSSGVLTGTPTTSGTFTFAVTVVDSAIPTKSATTGTLSLTVSGAAAPLLFPAQTLTTAVTGTAYTSSFTASGGTPPYNFLVTSGALPTGVALAANGTFSGTTTAVGSFPFDVTFTDSSVPPQTATQTFTLQVANPLAITTSTLPAGTVGTPYSANISSIGGVLPVGFAVTAGALPPGLGLSLAAAPPQTATISGTPTAAGTFTFTITAADSSSPAASASQSYTITIALGTLPTVVTVNPNTGFQGQQNLSVAITGQSTHFAQGTTVADFGSGVHVQSLTVGTSTTATAVLNIDAVPNAGIALHFFPNTAFNTDTAAMDATLGTTGYTIDSFETTALIPGLTIQLSGGVPTTTWTSLPNLLDGDVCPGLTSGQAWDGTNTSSNQISNQITGCTEPSGLATLTTLNYAPGATSFGIGFSNFQSVNPPSPQFPVTNHELFVNGVDMGVLETLAGAAWSPGLTRNAYLRIDGVNGGVITSVGIENLSSTAPVDFLMFDHLAVLPSAIAARNVTMTTNTEVAILPNGFTVNTNPLPPAIALVSPNTGAQGQQNLSVAITGASTHLVQGSTTASFGAGITVSSLTVTSPTNATAVLNIDPAAVTGARNVTVTTGAEAATLTNGFTVTLAPAPLAITTATLPNGTAGAAYSATVTSSGGTPPVSFSVSAGTLPPGLAPASSGAQSSTLSGTPTTAGTFTFTITATDSFVPAATASQSYTVTIAPAVAPIGSVTFLTPLPNSIEGQVLTASPVQVRVTDATNTPLPNASVSIGFNGTPPCAAATLGGTLTQITDATGTATFPDLTINRGQFGFALAAAAGNGTAISNSFNVEGFCDTGSMATARALHSSVTLPNGMVLIAGGSPSFSNRAVAFASAELYSPITHTFTTVGGMHVGRSAFTMTLLQSGLVLVAGGSNGAVAVSSAELFDPSTNTFTLLTNSMVTARLNHIATLLANGKVLMTGGNSNGTELASAEIFDPATNTFTATSQPMTTARDLHQAALLPNGKVLITGGFSTSGAINALASAEIYDPVADTFTSTGSMATPRYEHASALLFTGTVLVGGGFSGNGFTTPLAAAEIYDPSTGTFSPATSAPQTFVGFLSSVPALADGTVFLKDGAPDAQIYDPTAGTFRVTGNSTTLQSQPLTALLQDGTILVSGGVDSTGTGISNAEIFYPINVIPISITTLLPTALVNVPYSQQLEEKGGVGALTWTLSSGTLPAGLTLSTSGLLSGTPTTIGASLFTVQVTDSSTPPRATTAQFVVAVVPPLTIIQFLPTANPGVAYSQPILVAGGASPYTFSIISGSLPAGLTLNNGIISGTTSALGTFTFTIKATDSSTPPVSTTQAVTITVAPPLVIAPTTLPGGQVGVAYSATFSATGGSGTILFGLVSGTLPVGLTLTPLGVLSGTPNTASTFTFTIAAEDSSTEPQIAEQTYTVVIAPVAAPLALGPASLPAATVGVAYTQNFSISGGAPPYTVTQTGTPPPGLAFNGAANPPSITGTPTLIGTFGNITVTAIDSLGAQAQVTYSIAVNAFSAACATGNETLLNGQYVILMLGFDANGPRTLIGSISVNGAGGIPSGQLDIGTDLPTGGGSAQHLNIISAQSSFSVGPDRRGCMVLTTSAGSSSYRFVLGAGSSGVSNAGRIIDFQQNGAYGSGFIRHQDPSFLAAPSLSGSYAFLFTAPSSLANVGHWAVLGSFNASGGAVTSGSWDYNDTQKIDGGSAWPATGLQFPANESYTFDSTGRGTIQLPSVQQLSQSSILASANVVIYPLSSSEFFAAVLPDANNKPLAGDIQQQIAPFSSLAFNGAGYVNGVTATPILGIASVGAFSASQNAWNLSLDNDLGGTYSTATNSGTFAVDTTGRAPLAITNPASRGPIVQVIGPNKSFFMTPDRASSIGFVHNFPGGIPPSSVVGSYDFGPAEGTMDRKATNLAGIAVFDALGNVTFTQDQATGSTNTLTPGGVVASTYAYTTSTGRGVIPATGAPHFVFYATAQNVIYLVDVTSIDPQVLELDPLAPPALTLNPDPLQLFVGGSGTMDVILGSPAGSGGQVVSLTSSDPTIASVPASVTIAAGNQGIGFRVTAGANPGSVDITASAAGLPSTSATVAVSPLTMTVSPDSPLLAINRSFNATVTLVQPAGAGGVTVGLSASPGGLVTISPASQTIAAGQTTTVFSLTAGATSGSLLLTATAIGYINATAPLAVTGNLISFGTIPVLGPGQSASLPVSLSFAAPTGGLTINFTSTNSTIATVTPSVFVPAGLLIPSANPQVTGGAIGSAQINATATGFAPDSASVSVTVTGTLNPGSISVNAQRSVNVTLTISAAAPAGGITFNLASDNTSVATVPATTTVQQGQLTATFAVTGVTQGTANLNVSSPGITTITAPINVGSAPLINLNTPIVGNNLIAQGSLSLNVAPPTNPSNPTITFTSSDPTHFLLTGDPTKVGAASITLPLTAGSTSVPAYYIEGQNFSGSTAITATLTASAVGYADGTTPLTLYPTGLTYWPGNSGTLATTTFAAPSTLTPYLALLTPGTLNAYNYGYNLGPQASGSVPVAITSSSTSVGTLTGSPSSIGVGTYFTQAISFVPAAVGTTNLTITEPTGYFTPTNVAVQLVTTVTSPPINVSIPVVGNNLVEQGSISLGAPPPATPPSPTITLTSSDPTHFLLTADATKVGTASITLPLTPGNTNVPAFYIEGQNYSGTTAITATLTVTSAGYATATTPMTLYPTGLTYWPSNGGALSTTTFSSPSTLTIFLVLLSPGTLNAYNYGYNLGPQAPGSVPVAVASSATSVGTVTGSPSSIGVGAYFTQAISFVPAGAGTTNLNITEPTGYSTPSNVAVQMVTTVTAPALNLNAPVIGNNLIAPGSLGLGAAPPATPPNPTITFTSSDPTHFLLTADATKVGSASITLPLTPGSFAVPAYFIEGQNFSGTTAITATLTATSAGYATGTFTMTLYPTGLSYWPGNSGTLSTTTFSAPSVLTTYLVLLSPGTLNAYNYGYSLGPQAPGPVPVAVTSSSPSVGALTGSPSSIGLGTYFTQAISFVPATAGTTNLTIAEPTGYFTPSNVAVQIAATVTAPSISLAIPVIGNNMIAPGSVSLGAAPPSAETLTLTSSDPTHFLLTANPTKVGSAQIKLQLTGGSVIIPPFYVEGQNFSGAGAITATLTASAAGYNDGTFTLTLYPTGLSYWPGSGGSLVVNANSSPAVLTVYLVLLTPGTLNAYNYGFPLGPQAPGAVLVAVTSTDTTFGTISGSPSSIGVGTYYTQAISFVPVATGTTNLPITPPTGYSIPSNVAVNLVVTVQ